MLFETRRATSVLPAISPIVQSASLNVFQHRLTNGMDVFVAPMPHSRAVAARLFVRGGSSVEQAHEHGCAHFLEHLLFCGTPTRPDAHTITRHIERFGADLNAETTKEDTTLSIVSPPSHFESACEVLADMYLNSNLPPASVETERSAIAEELADNEDNLAWRCANLVERLVFGDSPLSNPIIGTLENLERVSRDVLFDFKKRWYSGRNSVLVVSGAIDERFFARAEHLFARARAEGERPEPVTIAPGSARVAVEDLNRDRTVIKLAFPLPGYHELPEHELEIAQIILGQTSFSRLESAFRLDSGLAYSLDCVHITYQQGGYSELTAEVSPKNTQRALDTLERVIERFARDGVSVEELDDAKLCGIGRTQLATQTPGDVADFIADELLTRGHITPPDEQADLLNGVSLESVNGAISTIFDPTRCRLAMTGKIPKRLKLPFGI